MQVRRTRHRVAALELDVLEAGPEDAPLALCLHGFPDHAPTWRLLLPALAAAGYRAVAPWMRGYTPDSIPKDGEYGLGALADDVLGLQAALTRGAPAPAVLIGHDWGALAATAAAIRAPERVRRLVTLAIPHRTLLKALATRYEQQKRSWYMFFFQTPLAEPAVRAGDFAFLRRLWKDWSPGYEPGAQEWHALCQTLGAPGVLHAAIGYYRGVFAPPPADPTAAAEQARMLSGEVPVEALYLHGDQDGCVGIETCEDLAAGYAAGLRLVRVEGAGHFLHLERPEHVEREILAFVGRATASGAG